MSAAWKTIRVFISSTFRDMHSERDWLVKRVFPELRERLEAHCVHLVDVDLRWGITEEQANNDQVLDLCLDQIDECRPFFVGLLGERYGWVPNELTDPHSKHGWTQLHTGKSVTELEILQGVLLKENTRDHGLFFFRDPTFADDVPEAKRSEVQAECPESAERLRRLKQEIRDAHLPIPVVENYPCRYAGLRINWRLARLSLQEADQRALEKVAADGLVDNTEYAGLDERLKTIVRQYGVVHLDGLEDFGRQVLDRLWDAIRDELNFEEPPPGETTVDPLEVELDYHLRFVESRLRVYIGRDSVLREVIRFADSDEQKPALVTGPPGSGKSAALANFVEVYGTAHPETLVIPHFIGASPDSTGLRQTLHRLCSVIKAEFDFAEEVPPDTDSLIMTFRKLLAQVPAERRVVLVIDALNQLDEWNDAQQLHWLPRQLPPHVKLITSCIRQATKEDSVLKAFRNRPHCPIEIPPLTLAERREIIKRVPSLSAKTLDNQQIGLLLSNPATENPLYLLVALEELRGFGSYEQLRHRMATMPRSPEERPLWESWLKQARAAATSLDDGRKRDGELQALERIESMFRQTGTVADPLTEIFVHVIERLQDEFHPETARSVLSLLASARRGLSDRELLDLVERHGVPVEESVSDLFPILRQLRSYLQYRGDLRDFFHRNLYKAVKKNLFIDDMAHRATHRRLAEYFHDLLNPRDAEPWSGDSARALSELPYHRIEAASWHDLERTLCDLRFVRSKCGAGMTFDLARDFAVALNSLPELRGAAEEQVRREEELRQYSEDLIACARQSRLVAQQSHHGGVFRVGALLRRLVRTRGFVGTRNPENHATLPTPPNSRRTHDAMRRAEAASAAPGTLRGELTPAARIQSYAVFVSKHIHRLNRDPDHTIGFGLNHASSGPVVDQAEALLRGATTPFLRRDLRPPPSPMKPLCVRVLEGHSSRVNAVALTSDGNTAVAASGTALIVWDVASGEMLRTLEAEKTVSAMAMTPDGSTVVAVGADGMLRVWDIVSGGLSRVEDIASGARLKTIQGHFRGVKALAITPDAGRTAFVTHNSADLNIWDIVAGELRSTFSEHSSALVEAALAPDGATAVSACSEGTFRVWDVDNGELLRKVGREHADHVLLTPDGRIGISMERGTLRMWNLATGELLRMLRLPFAFRIGAVTPDGNTAIAADGREVWDLASGTLLRRLGNCRPLAMTPDAAMAIVSDVGVSGLRDSTLQVWDIASGELTGHADQTSVVVCTPTKSLPCWIRGVSFDTRRRLTSPDVDLRGVSDGSESIDGWDIAHGAMARALNDCIEFAITPDGRRVVSTTSRKANCVWDVPTGHIVSTLEESTGRIRAMEFTPDGNRGVFETRKHHTLCVWNLASGKLLFTRDVAGLIAVALTPAGDTLVSAGQDVQVWDVASGELLRTLQGHRMVVLTPDGKTAVSACGKSLLVWSVATGRQLNVLKGHHDAISAVVFMPDANGHLVTSTGNDGIVGVWNLACGGLIAVYPGDTAYLAVAAASKRRLVAKTRDQLHYFTLSKWP